MATMMRCNVASRAAVRPSRATVVVRAQASAPQRFAMGLVATAVTGALLLVAPQPSEAIKIPSHEFTGGMVKGGGSSPKSPSGASMESYIMEGTRKQGVSLKTKKKLLAKVREQASKTAAAKAT